MSEHTFSAMQRRKNERSKWWSEFYAYRLDPNCLCGYPLTPDGPWYQPHFILGPCTVHEDRNVYGPG